MNETSVTFDPALIAPLAGEGGAGRDLTYEAGFQSLQAEVDKANALTGGAVDWRRVKDECERLLRTETRDLRCASWLVVAEARTVGWSAVTASLAFYKAFVETNWDAMYPPAKRVRARVGLVEWLFENLRQALGPVDIAAQALDGARGAVQALRDLDAALAAKLGDAAPGAGQLRSVLRDKLESANATFAPPPPPPPPPPPAALTPVAAPASTSAPSSTVIDPVVAPPALPPVAAPAAPLDVALPTPASFDPAGAGSVEGVVEAAAGWSGGLSSLGSAARTVDATAPLGYRLARMAAWLVVDVPPNVENGRTFIRGPRPGEVSGVQDLLARREWVALLETAESTLAEHIFWLDLNRFTWAALDGLGPRYDAAKRAVVCETVNLTSRIPELETLSFRTGVPFADAATVAWLVAQRGGGGASAGARDSAADDSARGIVADARTVCSRGDVVDGIGAGLAEAARLTTAKARYLARAGIAQLASDLRRPDIAVAILEPLLGELDSTLEEWEPAAAVKAIAVYLAASGFRGEGTEEATRQRQRLLFQRLLRLDPTAALKLMAD